MVMYYRDMNRLSLGATTIRFSLSKRLAHFEKRGRSGSGIAKSDMDSDPQNTSHAIAIELPASAIVKVKSDLMGFMR